MKEGASLGMLGSVLQEGRSGRGQLKKLQEVWGGHRKRGKRRGRRKEGRRRGKKKREREGAEMEKEEEGEKEEKNRGEEGGEGHLEAAAT